jgi:adenylate kinase family enzyme
MHSSTGGERRIAVVGTSCTGKTTLARKLSRLLNVPHIELDSIYWRPNWDPLPPGQFRALVSKKLETACWVVDGNYSVVRDIVWSRATILIWLNYSFPIVFGRALSRTFRRVAFKEELFSGNRESLRNVVLSTDSIPIWVLRTFWKRRREYPALFKESMFSHLRIIEVRNQHAVDELIHELVVEYQDSVR